MLTKDEAEDDDVRNEREVVDQEMVNPPANDPYAVRLVHMKKRYWARGKERTGTVAVKDLSLRMKRGECFALLGGNGAGKSTTLNMLLRLASPTAGTSYIEELI